MSDMSDIARLAAVEEIKLIQAKRSYAVDTKDWALYESLHAPDHVADNDGDQRRVGAKANAERIAATLVGKTTMHHLHTPIITFETPTRANGIWAMDDHLWWKQGDEEHWLHGYGFYYETYEKRDGRWVFTSRKLRRNRVETSPGAKFP